MFYKSKIYCKKKLDKISCRIRYRRSYTEHPASIPHQCFDTQTISVPSRLKDVSLGMRLPRKSDAPLCLSCEYTRTEHGSIIIGRSAKPKSVRESSLYSVLPHRRHFLWRTETRALGEGGRGFVPTLIIIGSFTKRTRFSLYRACTRDATRRDVARRTLYDA